MSTPILFGSPRAQKNYINPKTGGMDIRNTSLGFRQIEDVSRYVIPPPPPKFPQTVHQGTIASYGFGGFRGGYAPNDIETVDKMPFASLGTATVVSTLPGTFSGKQSIGAVDRVGNTGIGFPSPGLIHKVPFANDTAAIIGGGLSSTGSVNDASFSDTNNRYGIYGTTVAGTAFKRLAYVSETASEVAVSNAPPNVPVNPPSTPSTKSEGGITDNIQDYGYVTFGDGNMQGFAFSSGTPYTLGTATIVYSPAAPSPTRGIFQGHSSSERGYRWTRGDGPGAPYSVSFPFNSGVIVTEDLGNAIGGTQERFNYSATNSQEHGYLSGGSVTNPIGSDVISRFPFAASNNVFTDVGQLSSIINTGLGGWAS
jgi:hypothetical protein